MSSGRPMASSASAGLSGGVSVGVRLSTRVATAAPRYLSELALSRVCEFVESHLFDQIMLDDLAKVAFLSRFHFSRRFRLATGKTPMLYLQRCRIERAKWLLLAGEQSVSEIASKLVFADHSHFCRVFRRTTGLSPSQFLQRAEASENSIGQFKTSVCQ